MLVHVIDFEGNPCYGIIEFGVVTLDGGKISQTSTSLCKPDAAISPEDIQVHGLREDMLRDQPAFSGFKEQFERYRYQGVLAAHHASVEDRLLSHYWHTLPAKATIEHPVPSRGSWGPWIDSRLVYRHYYDLENYSLGSLIGAFQLERELQKLAEQYCPRDRRKSHCALYDALASALLLMAAGENLGIREEVWLRVSQSSGGEDLAQKSLF